MGIVAIMFTYVLLNALNNNFYEVVGGEPYRSGQPDEEEIRKYVDHYKIRTILNLRGENIGKDWYDSEFLLTRELGVNLINFPISSKRILDIAEVEDLLRIMKEAPKPILIHCAGGADRTGIVSALYMAGVSRKSEFESELQLSPIYGHFSIPYIGAPNMDATFELLEPSLGYNKS